MDVCALSRFHASVTRLPIESQSIPAGGSSSFPSRGSAPQGFPRYYCGRLRLNELRVSHNRFNTPAEASWMFYLISVFLHAIGFDGDDADVGPGFNPLEMAKSEAEFLLCRSTENGLLRRSMERAVSLEYPEYDLPKVIDEFFPHRRAPQSFPRIREKKALPISCDLAAAPKIWSDAGRVVEATLVALSRVKSQVKVETDEDGIVIGVLKSSVDEVLAEMVHSSSIPSSAAKSLVEERSNSSIGRNACPSPCFPGAPQVIVLEEWLTELVSLDPEE
ncbi:hypothetical protein B0H13DRAFT_1922532 [Mycena leptocephala]|nr:hypothetical protein B0H13DRAFT_1922532 [Mycena leptocephala]